MRRHGVGAGPTARSERDLKIGFISNHRATPIIMAEPMGFYKSKASSGGPEGVELAMIRDISDHGEPTPLTCSLRCRGDSLGVGRRRFQYVMPGSRTSRPGHHASRQHKA